MRHNIYKSLFPGNVLLGLEFRTTGMSLAIVSTNKPAIGGTLVGTSFLFSDFAPTASGILHVLPPPSYSPFPEERKNQRPRQ
jgi:hypothetical protein